MTLQRTQEESVVFDALEVPGDTRGRTYLAAFLSCWLCTFALLDDEKGFIRPGTFEVASNMAADAHSLSPCQCWQAFIEA